jgi:hypothetical protein
VAVKKRKEDFMILTTDTSNMDDELNAAHMLFRDAILQEMGLRRVPVIATTRVVTMAMSLDQQTTLLEDLGTTQRTGGKRAYGPGSFGPSVPVAEPGSITRDQCRSRFEHEPGPIGLHVDARRREGGLGHWSRFVERTGIVDPGFFSI